MALTERSFVDEISVEVETGKVFWRTVTVIERDGVEVTRTYHKRACRLDADLPADAPQEVVRHRNVADTPAAREGARKARERMAQAAQFPPGLQV